MTSTVSTRTKLTIVGAAGLSFCGVLVETAMNVTFPTLMAQFHASLSGVQWVTTAYLLTVAITMVITAYLEARFTAKTLLATSTSLFVLGGLICALAPSLLALLGGRVIQGVATGIAMPLFFATIMQKVPQRLQGIYVGTGGVVIALAPSLGPSYGGMLTQTLGWRMIFWCAIPVGVLAGLLALLNVEQTVPVRRQRFPLAQFLLIAAALITLTLGLNVASSAGLAAPRTWGTLLLGLVLLAGFVRLAGTAKSALIDLHIFKSRQFTSALLIYFLAQFMQISQTILIPNYAQIVLHRGAFAAGAMLLAGSFVAALIGPLAGRVFDRRGIRVTAGIACTFIAVSTFGMAVLGSHPAAWLVIAANVVFMIGFGFLFNNTLTFGLQQLPVQTLGSGNACFNTLQQYAGAMGTAVIAGLLGMNGRGVVGTALGAHWSYLLLAVITVVVITLSATLHPTESR